MLGLQVCTTMFSMSIFIHFIVISVSVPRRQLEAVKKTNQEILEHKGPSRPKEHADY